MIQLFIENKQVFIDDTVRFPFSHKINDLNGFDIIGLEKSKTISIKRVPQNDDIFGYLGDIQRLTFNYDDDHKTSVSYNQTKQISYTLTDDGETVSNGKIIVENITNDNYELTLYDDLIFMLEILEGDSQTGEGYLNDLDIINKNGNILEFDNYVNNIKVLDDKCLKPVVNITDDDLKNNKFRCVDGATNKLVTYELEGELTQLQARTIKSNQLEYATPINSVIESINAKYDDLIVVDPKLDKYFNELHLHLGKQKMINKVETVTQLKSISGITTVVTNPLIYPKVVYTSTYPLGTVDYNVFSIPLNNLSNQPITKLNGKYYIELPIELKLQTTDNTTGLLSYFGETNTNWNTTNIKNGVYFGNFYIKTFLGEQKVNNPQTLAKFDNYNVKVINNKIDCIYGLNSNYSIAGNVFSINIYKTLVLQFDFYPKLTNTNYNLAIKLDLSNPQTDTIFFANNYTGDINNVTFKKNYNILLNTTGGNVQYNSFDKIYTGEKLNGKTLYPKIPIKTFLLSLAKYHNLEMINVDGKLLIRKKLYIPTDEQLNIAKINAINTKMFEFSKMSITTDLSDNELLKTYEDVNKQKYGQKNINLNYSIRKKVNEIKYDIAIPTLVKDTNKIAYDSFGGYYNAGRKKGATGITNGLNNKLSFCFINEIFEDPIWIVDDTAFEAGIYSSNEFGTPEDVEWVKTNWLVWKDNIGRYRFTETLNDIIANVGFIKTPVTQSSKLNSYYTSTPYKIDYLGNISKSLEINKPKYNYAGISDAQYTDEVTHYDKYLKRQIEDRYSPNTHILDCDILFNNKPDIYRIYNYQNVNYIISELPEFEIGGGLSTGVKLLKVNDITNYTNPYGIEEAYLKINFFGNVTKNSVRVNNLIEYSGGDTFVYGGVKYGTNPTNLNSQIQISNPTNVFAIDVTNLVKNTVYYFQSYVIGQSNIQSFSDIEEVRTLDDYTTPTSQITNVSNITQTSFTITGKLLSEGGYPVSRYGFCIGLNPNPTTETVLGTISNYNEISYTFTGLSLKTLYYVRYFAVNQNGISYSDNQLVTTLPPGMPSITTVVATNVIPKSITSGGSNIQLNGGVLTQKGWVAKVNGLPTITDYTVRYRLSTDDSSDFVGTGFNYNEALVGQTVQYRAFAVTRVGLAYGETLYVNVPNYSVPTVTTGGVAQITYNSLTLFGKFVNNGYYGQYLTQNAGVVYSATNSNPTVGGADCLVEWYPNTTYDGDMFEILIPNLQPLTNYYYRCFGKSNIGYGYGETYVQSTSTTAPSFDEFIVRRPSFVEGIYEPDMYIELNIDTVEPPIEGGILFEPQWDTITDITLENANYRIDFNYIQGGLNNYFYQHSLLEDYPIGTITYRAWLRYSGGIMYSFYVNDTLKKNNLWLN